MKLFIIGLATGLFLGVGLPALGAMAYKHATEVVVGNEPQNFLSGEDFVKPEKVGGK